MTTEQIQQKIYAIQDVSWQRMLSFWRFKNKRIVFTNGCFDIIHRGHAEYLAKASALGDVLIVGMNTDDSVKRLKGEGRPVNNQENRAFVLASMGFVAAVVFFDEDTPESLIVNVKPDFLVKGADYSEDQIVGAPFVKSYGGKIVTIDLVQGLSTSGLIQKMKG
jgi:rfaE bifunctional protein nucleotidyltransferase chain/domain